MLSLLRPRARDKKLSINQNTLFVVEWIEFLSISRNAIETRQGR